MALHEPLLSPPPEKTEQKYLNFWKAIFVSFLFLWVYTPFFCVQNLLTDVMQKNGFKSLGFVLLGVLYLSQMIGCFFSPSIVQLMGLKSSFIFGCFTVSSFVFIQILPTWRQERMQQSQVSFSGEPFFIRQDVIVFFMYIANIISGFGTAVFWTAQGEYISKCCSKNSIGFYFSIFWSFFQSSQIFGNLIGAIIITKTSGPSFFLILGLIIIIGNAMFFFLKAPEKQAKELMCEQPDELQSKPTFKETVLSTIKLLFSKKMMLMNPIIWWTGISFAVYSGLLTPIIIFQIDNDPRLNLLSLSNQEKQSKALYGMIAFGIAQIVGSLTMGKIVDFFGAKKSIFYVILIHLQMILTTLYALKAQRYDWNTFVLTFMWGLQDSSYMILVNSILGSEFTSKSEPFAVLYMLQGIVVSIIEIIQSYLNLKDQRSLETYVITIGLIGLLFTLITFTVPFKKKEAKMQLNYV